MSKKIYDEVNIQNIASAIRQKTGSGATYKVSQMADAILALNPSPILQSKNITPSASQQTVQPDNGYDGLSSVVVNGDTDLVAENIKKDVEIFGVTGNYEGSGGGGGSALLTPVSYNANNGYINYGNFFPNSSGDFYLDVYEVRANHRYMVCVSPRTDYTMSCIIAFFTSNPVEAGTFQSGIEVESSAHSLDYWCLSPAYLATANGFLVVQKNSKGESGVISYCCDIGT